MHFTWRMNIMEDGNRNCTKNICKHGDAFEATARRMCVWQMETLHYLAGNYYYPSQEMHVFFSSRSLHPTYFKGTPFGSCFPNFQLQDSTKARQKTAKAKAFTADKAAFDRGPFFWCDFVSPCGAVRGNRWKKYVLHWPRGSVDGRNPAAIVVENLRISHFW